VSEVYVLVELVVIMTSELHRLLFDDDDDHTEQQQEQQRRQQQQRQPPPPLQHTPAPPPPQQQPQKPQQEAADATSSGTPGVSCKPRVVTVSDIRHAAAAAATRADSTGPPHQQRSVGALSHQLASVKRKYT